MHPAVGLSATSRTEKHDAEHDHEDVPAQDASLPRQQTGDPSKGVPALRSGSDWATKISKENGHSHDHGVPDTHAAPEPRPGSVDGTFTWGEAAYNLGKGALHALTSVVEVFKEKPLLATGAGVGLVGLLAVLPAAVPYVVTAATAWSGFRIVKSIGSALRFRREGKPDDAERALRGAGEGVVGLAFVALGKFLAGATEGLGHAGHAAHGEAVAHAAGHVGEGHLAQSASALIHIHDLPVVAGALATGHGEHKHED